MATRKSTKDAAGNLEPDVDSTALDVPTESLTFTVALPVQVHEQPEDEAAVSIDEVAITTDYLSSEGPATTTIQLVAEDVATMPPAEEEPPIPALPEPDDVYSRRRQRPEVSATPEPATALTAERLIHTPKRNRKPAPEGFLQRLLYDATFRLVNVGDSYRVRERKALDARIGKPFEGGTRFVAVLTRKG